MDTFLEFVNKLNEKGEHSFHNIETSKEIVKNCDKTIKANPMPKFKRNIKRLKTIHTNHIDKVGK